MIRFIRICLPFKECWVLCERNYEETEDKVPPTLVENNITEIHNNHQTYSKTK